ncbi:hypothetical protein [Myxosarcina sp. GI1(2024)]
MDSVAKNSNIQKNRELQALVRRLDDLMEMRHQEMNRIKASCHLESVQDSLENLVEYLEEQIQTIKNLIPVLKSH